MTAEGRKQSSRPHRYSAPDDEQSEVTAQEPGIRQGMAFEEQAEQMCNPNEGEDGTGNYEVSLHRSDS
jgi:hypothetical protein